MIGAQLVGWSRLTTSGVVAWNSCRLLRLVVLVSAAGALVSVYEGLDAGSGRLIGNFTAPVAMSLVLDFGGLSCDRGLYVALGANVTEVTAVFETVGDRGQMRITSPAEV